MDLTAFDRESTAWQKMKAYYEARLRLLREQNDGEMSSEKRNQLIGRIHEVKSLLELERTKPVMAE